MTKQEINDLRKRANKFFILKNIFIAMPYPILLAIKGHEWIKTQEDAISFTIGGFLCVLVLALVLMKRANFLKSGVAKFMFAILVAWLFETAMQDLILILGCGLGGCILFEIFNAKQKNCMKIYNKYQQSAATVELMQSGESFALDEKGRII